MVLTGPYFQGSILGHGVSVGIRKKDAELKAFDVAIAATKDDGTIKRISEKWFGFNVSTR